jgi:hypothetical protein
MNILLKYFIFFLLGIIIYYFLFNSPNIGAKKVIEGFNYNSQASNIIPQLFVKTGYNKEGDTISEIEGETQLPNDLSSTSITTSLLTRDINKSYLPIGEDEGDDNYSLSLRINPTPPILKINYKTLEASNSPLNGGVFSFTLDSGSPDLVFVEEPSSIISEANTIMSTDNQNRSTDTDPARLELPVISSESNKLMVFSDTGNTTSIILELSNPPQGDDANPDYARLLVGGFMGGLKNMYIILSDSNSNLTLSKSLSVFKGSGKSIIRLINQPIDDIINVFNDSVNYWNQENNYLVIGLNNINYDGITAPTTGDILSEKSISQDPSTKGEIGTDGIDYFTGQTLLNTINRRITGQDTDTFNHSESAAFLMMSAFASTNADGSQQKLQGCKSYPLGVESLCATYQPIGRYQPKSDYILNSGPASQCNAQTDGVLKSNPAFGTPQCNSDPNGVRGSDDMCCQDRSCSALFVENNNMCGEGTEAQMKKWNAICPLPPSSDADELTPGGHCSNYCCGITIHSYLEELFTDIINFNTSKNVTITNRRIGYNHIRNYIYGYLLDLDYYEGLPTLTSDSIGLSGSLADSTSGEEYFTKLDNIIHFGNVDGPPDSLNNLEDNSISISSNSITIKFALCNGVEEGSCGTAAANINQEKCSIAEGICISPYEKVKQTIGHPNLEHIKLAPSITDAFTETDLTTSITDLQTIGDDDSNLNTILSQGQKHNYSTISNSYKNFINRYIQGNRLETGTTGMASSNFVDDIKESIFSLTMKFDFHDSDPIMHKSPLESSYSIQPGRSTMTYTQFAEAI